MPEINSPTVNTNPFNILNKMKNSSIPLNLGELNNPDMNSSLSTQDESTEASSIKPIDSNTQSLRDSTVYVDYY